jgi:hypothetical protein
MSSSSTSHSGRKIDMKIMLKDVELCCCEFKVNDEKWKREKQLVKSLHLNKTIASAQGFAKMYAMDWNGK